MDSWTRGNLALWLKEMMIGWASKGRSCGGGQGIKNVCMEERERVGALGNGMCVFGQGDAWDGTPGEPNER